MTTGGWMRAGPFNVRLENQYSLCVLQSGLITSELPFLNQRNAVLYDSPGLLEQFISRPEAKW
jgi:hypothetical protein